MKTFNLALILFLTFSLYVDCLHIAKRYPGEGDDGDDTCVDDDRNCPGWANRGECDKNPNWMKVNCKKSCKTCTGGGGGDTGGGGGDGATAFERECLDAHNQHRRKHQAPDLVLDDQLNKDAAAWAKKLSGQGYMEHDMNAGAGENLYWSSSSSVKALGTTAIQAWYDEVKDYKYSRPGFGYTTGHFTQVVWKGSEKLGCGYAVGNTGTYVVARYTPAGNWKGRFPENVLPLK